MISPNSEPPPHSSADADQIPTPPTGARAFWTNPYRDGHPVDAERRDNNRVLARPDRTLRCSLGEIIDMSTRGVRIARRRALTPGGDIFSFTLRSGRDRLTLRGACVWSRRSGFMRHTAGIALAGMTPDEARLLRAFIDRHAAGPVLSAA
jgi:hypothetical protein